MKGYSGLYYLFFVLLIMGGFAAMAQNRYGLYILGAVGVLFGILFLYQCIYILVNPAKAKPFWAIEPGCLAVLSFLITLRVFYIRFPFIETIFGITILLLIGFYAYKMAHYYREYQPLNSIYAFLTPAFYFSIILYLISMGSASFWPSLSFFTGVVAFGIFLLVVVFGILRGNQMMKGENVSFLKVLSRLKDNSVLIISLFCLFTLYAGLTRSGVLPKIYSDEYPQAYFDLVNKSESVKVSSKKGTESYQDFKDKYDHFLKNNIRKSK